MNRDRIVFRICDEILSEKLKLNVKLTDDKAVTQVSQAKAVKQQQPLLRGGDQGVSHAPVGFGRQNVESPDKSKCKRSVTQHTPSSSSKSSS